MTWGVTALLSGVRCADKEAVFLYLFLGYYPILKPSFDRAGRFRGLAVKLLYFAAALLVMNALILFVLGPAAEAGGKWAAIALGFGLAAVMLLFDAALYRVTLLYERRLRTRLFKRRD